MVTHDQATNLLIKSISPNKFKEGGADMLLEHKRNHHKVNLGINLNIPLLIKILRL